MDSLGGNISPPNYGIKTIFTGIAGAVIGSICLSAIFSRKKSDEASPGLLKSFLLFFYSCFIKPHNGDHKGTQQDALESFYSTQAKAYDSTRRVLLKGREDMLALVAAQLQSKPRRKTAATRRRRSVSGST